MGPINSRAFKIIMNKVVIFECVGDQIFLWLSSSFFQIMIINIGHKDNYRPGLKCKYLSPSLMMSVFVSFCGKKKTILKNI